MSILALLREEIQGDAKTNIFGRKVYPKIKDNHVLYLAARMRDAENDKKASEALATATESAALTIIGRYEPDAARDFYKLVQQLKSRYLR